MRNNSWMSKNETQSIMVSIESVVELHCTRPQSGDKKLNLLGILDINVSLTVFPSNK